MQFVTILIAMLSATAVAVPAPAGCRANGRICGLHSQCCSGACIGADLPSGGYCG
ncbi:hypothetical protein DCS_01765 [Drechmeria coniospora]|uniref:Uncharacterized protein n=1 Tax=Drechmeria coniospora TaxID=98403 RepID=A0A151GU52_DRECN|nr:hypothetical protein DCS_01765 [Drechmeria coniospora]KYK60627.1 hypothetical protein DCS_01765 [Drechmeria coniospora]